MNWLDIFLLVIFFLHLVSGFSRGMVKQLFDMFGFIIIIFLSFWGGRFFADPLAEYIDPENIIPHHQLFENMGLEMALEQVPLFIGGILAFLGLFIVLSIGFRLISGGFQWFNRVPVIGFFNRIGGGLMGVLIGMVFIYIIVTAVSLIPLQFFIDAVDNSEVAFITDHYLTPLFEMLKTTAVNYYINLNS